MLPEEAAELMEAKLTLVADKAAEEKVDLRVDPEVISRVVALSGGHPHILQLLGSHLVTHEIEDPDGVIDSRDLVNSLRRICYEDRVRAYDSTIHMLELNGRLESLSDLFQFSVSIAGISYKNQSCVRHREPRTGRSQMANGPRHPLRCFPDRIRTR